MHTHTHTVQTTQPDMAGRDLDHISRQAYACNQGNGSRKGCKMCVHTDIRVSVCFPPVVQPILQRGV